MNTSTVNTTSAATEKHVIDVYCEDTWAFWNDDDPWCVEWSDGTIEHRLKYDELPEEAQHMLDEE